MVIVNYSTLFMPAYSHVMFAKYIYGSPITSAHQELHNVLPDEHVDALVICLHGFTQFPSDMELYARQLVKMDSVRLWVPNLRHQGTGLLVETAEDLLATMRTSWGDERILSTDIVILGMSLGGRKGAMLDVLLRETGHRASRSLHTMGSPLAGTQLADVALVITRPFHSYFPDRLVEFAHDILPTSDASMDLHYRFHSTRTHHPAVVFIYGATHDMFVYPSRLLHEFVNPPDGQIGGNVIFHHTTFPNSDHFALQFYAPIMDEVIKSIRRPQSTS